MVLCSFFLTNSCRYGNKCKLEHINIKASIKADVESASKGNQWPLSCYGPFNGKACVANFIDDQSFEEVRFLCYEAKAQGSFQQLQQQLLQRYNDAKNKMNQLFELNNDILMVIADLYNSSESNQVANQTTTSSNPFAVSGFNSSNNTSGNIFGASVSSNPFSNNGPSNVFGSNIFNTAKPPTQSNTNLFGQSQASTNMFGSSSSSIFGGVQPTNISNNAFGNKTTSGPFSLSQIGQPQIVPNNVFGTTNTSSTASNIFGQANAALIQPSHSTNVFGQSTTQPFTSSNSHATQSSGGNIFGGQTTNNTAFTNMQNNTSVFNSSGYQPIQQPNAFTQPSTQNIFSSNQHSFPTSTNNVTPLSAPQQSAESHSAIIFGTAMSAQKTFITPAFTQPQQGIDKIYNVQTQSGNAFGNSSASNVFQQSQAHSNVFGGNAATLSALDESLYSKMEDLSKEDVEKYESDKFELGNIPILPPARQLCV